MQFTCSEVIKTSASQKKVEKVILSNFEENSGDIFAGWEDGEDDKFENKTIYDIRRMFLLYFGSDRTHVKIEKKGHKYLIKTSTKVHLTLKFWIVLLIFLFTYILWILPIAMLFVQKSNVEKSVKEVLSESKKELEL